MSAEVERLIAQVPWRATDYLGPHEYVVASWDESCAALVEAIRGLIAERGYRREFHGYTYEYVNVGEYRYWVLEFVLNRARLGVAEA